MKVLFNQFIFIFILGIFLDLLIGDPEFLLHPVEIIGSLITFLEENLHFSKNKWVELFSGTVIVITVLLFTFFSVRFILFLFTKSRRWIDICVKIYFFSTAVATRGLKTAGKEIYWLLKENNIREARKKTGFIVGRDTDKMGSSDIVRAVIETMAENISDGIIAPAFYYFLGGIPLALTYKAVNTLDSMLGHRSDEYMYFGRTAARLDDIANFIPARLTAFCIWLSAVIISDFNSDKFWKIIMRDAPQHPSLNAGFPESASAVTLGIRLGGLNYYEGEPEFRNYLNEKGRKGELEDIKRMNKLLNYTVGFSWVLLLVFYLLFRSL
ncbi:MAG: adenosylcobinamide-phosphate synthase CbiB [Halanaerobiales bacterium]